MVPWIEFYMQVYGNNQCSLSLAKSIHRHLLNPYLEHLNQENNEIKSQVDLRGFVIALKEKSFSIGADS